MMVEQGLLLGIIVSLGVILYITDKERIVEVVKVYDDSGLSYAWECPSCGAKNESLSDPENKPLRCVYCGDTFHKWETTNVWSD